MKPNIVMFFPDQLRRDALGCYGNTVCKTPNLDRLALEGVKFENAFNTSPTCSPSRASLLTGLYPHNHGVMINTHIAPAWSQGLSPETQTFSSIMDKSGYKMNYIGKWHVNEKFGPDKFGFKRPKPSASLLKRPRGPNRPVPGTETIIDLPGGSHLIAATSTLPKESYETWLMADFGIEVIRRCAKDKKPFFLRMDMSPPHFANVVPEPYASMYDPDKIPPWPSFDENFSEKPACHLRKHKNWNLQDKD